MKKTLCMLFSIFLSTSIFSQTINFFTLQKPDFTVSTSLAGAIKKDFRSSPVRFDQTFSADMKEIFQDCGFAVQESKLDFVYHLNYMPLFFQCFRFGVGFNYHFYRYFDVFTENDLIFSSRFRWCRTDFFNFDVVAGFMLKFAQIDSIKKYKSIIDNYSFTFEYLCNWNLTPEWTVYASLASIDSFDYPLFGTPFFKGGFCYKPRKYIGFDTSLSFKFIDMVVSTTYLSQCILKTSALVYF